MKIAIFRHGHAKSIFESKVRSDFERELSQRGVLQVKKSSSKLKEEGFLSDIIISSPLKRSVETASIISLEFEISNIELTDFLSPGSDIFIAIDYIKSKKRNMIIVGHMPFLSELLAVISGNPFVFSTGGYVRLDYKENQNAKIISHYFPD